MILAHFSFVFFRFKSDPFNSTASQTAMAKASQEQADMKKAVGKIGVDGKLEDANQTPNVQGYSFVGAPSPAPGKLLLWFTTFLRSNFILVANNAYKSYLFNERKIDVV